MIKIHPLASADRIIKKYPVILSGHCKLSEASIFDEIFSLAQPKNVQAAPPGRLAAAGVQRDQHRRWAISDATGVRAALLVATLSHTGGAGHFAANANGVHDGHCCTYTRREPAAAKHHDHQCQK